MVTTMDEEEEEYINLIRRQPLDAGGTCTKCEKKADMESIQCFGCSKFYHVINCPPGAARGQVTRTFFGGWDNMVENYKNILYMCTASLHDKKMKNYIIVSNRMCVLEEEVKGVKETIEKKFSDLQDIMLKLVKGREDISAPRVQTYADRAASMNDSPGLSNTEHKAS